MTFLDVVKVLIITSPVILPGLVWLILRYVERETAK